MDSATTAALVEQQLACSVQDSLKLLLFDNARFMCERLVAMCGNEQNRNLLALCYFHCNQAYRSYHLLKGLQGAQSRYLFALSCLQLGKVNEARDALSGRAGGQGVPNGAAGHYLLGKACRLAGRTSDAKEHFTQALKLDPLLWSAFEELCALGADEQAGQVCAAAQVSASSAQAAIASGSFLPDQLQGTTTLTASGPAAGFAMHGSGGGNGAAGCRDGAAARAAGGWSGAAEGAGVGPGSAMHFPQVPAGALDLTPVPFGFGDAAMGGTGTGRWTGAHAGVHGGNGSGWGFGQGHAAQQGQGLPIPGHGASHDPPTGSAVPHARPSAAVNLFPDWQTPMGPGTGQGPGLGFAAEFVTPAMAGGGQQGLGGLASSRYGQQQQQQQGHQHRQYPMAVHQPDSTMGHFGATHHQGEPEAGHAYQTPMPNGIPSCPPAPPQKDEGAFGRRQAQHASGTAQYPGGSGQYAGGAVVAVNGEPGSHRGAAYGALGPAGDGGPSAGVSAGGGGGGGGGGGSRLLEDGKVRKVSGRLFQEPSRRSSRLAAKDGSVGTGPSGGVGGGGGGGGTPRSAWGGRTHGHGGQYMGQGGSGSPGSVPSSTPSHGQTGVVGSAGSAPLGAAAVGGAVGTAVSGGPPPTYHECQNLPDPDHPPASPCAATSQLQAYVDAKLRGGATPGAAVGSVTGADSGGGGGGGPGTPGVRMRLSAAAAAAVQTAPQGQGQGHGQEQGGMQHLFGQGRMGAHGTTVHGLAGAPGGQLRACQEDVAESVAGSVALAAVALGLTQGALLPLMEGARHLAMYRCSQAVQALSRLPKPQYNTAWVLSRVARAHFERTDYAKAASAFEAARSVDRHCLEGMDRYSTALWHLRRGCELSYLAQELLSIDRLAPQAWCALGNLCSFQKEHESAIQLFQRAVQLDPGFTYAYTLAGHEYCAGEDHDKALSCYRTAVRLDPRHYNAMFGVGQVYLKQEKYEMATVHFKSASNINPCSSVLLAFVGVALHKQGLLDSALSKLCDAATLDPKNPLARYEKAAVLQAMDRPADALAELQHLAHLSPGEPSVYLQMGKLYKRLGDTGRAQQQLELALSFKSGSVDASVIKAAIEKLGVGEDRDEDGL